MATPQLLRGATDYENPRIRQRYIAFEGIDGSGKSTQLDLLRGYLRRRFYTAIGLEEPTYGRWGREIRKHIETGRPLSVERQQRMFTLDRRQHVKEKLRPLLRLVRESPTFLILQDRTYLSAAAYQATGFSREELRTLIAAQTEFAPEPDIFILLDLSVDVAMGRLHCLKVSTSQFERKDILEAAKRRYRILADMVPRKIRIINANGTPQQVHTRILRMLGLPSASRERGIAK